MWSSSYQVMWEESVKMLDSCSHQKWIVLISTHQGWKLSFFNKRWEATTRSHVIIISHAGKTGVDNRALENNHVLGYFVNHLSNKPD